MPDEYDAPVEQATAAPGEKRDLPRSNDGARTVCPCCRGFGYIR